MLRSHLYAEPPQRWTGWDYTADEEVWKSKVLRDGDTQYFLGDALLIGGVFEPGSETARMYLPQVDTGVSGSEQFLNINAPYQYLGAGQWVDIEAKWDESIPVLAKVGTLIPVGKAEQTHLPGEKNNLANLSPDDYRAVELFPPKGNGPSKGFRNSWLEDDGISPAQSPILNIELVYTCDEHTVNIVEYSHMKLQDDKRTFLPPWKELQFILPVGDERSVKFKGKDTVAVGADCRQRSCFKLDLAVLLSS
jgi:hypothetical protein